MGQVVGIDLGTTNSVIATLDEGQPWAIPDDEGDLLLPSFVGISDGGELLVGQAARRQYAAAPDRTVKSIKRQMGTDFTVTLNDRTYNPQEVSAIILRSLKQRAETMLETEVTQAVITVPAYFTDAQRQATKEAGEIAGFEVLQILNEPTAAALVFDVGTEDTENVLVYDLGGGTFDVSIVEITGDVTEVLASHGNNRLGGDDFDRQLQRHLADKFLQTHGVEVPTDPATQARLLLAAEQAKIDLSEKAFTTVREPFLVSKGETALHLETENRSGRLRKPDQTSVERNPGCHRPGLRRCRHDPPKILTGPFWWAARPAFPWCSTWWKSTCWVRRSTALSPTSALAWGRPCRPAFYLGKRLIPFWWM